MTRAGLRTELADAICSWPKERLLKYGITRVGDVTGLDTVGLPVYTSCRPSGKVIAISSGKGLTKRDAKAGAIIESMELWAAEQVDTVSAYCNYLTAVKHLDTPCIPFDKLPLCRDSILNVSTPISWDTMFDLKGATIYVPSEMIWMVEKVPHPFAFFVNSSNGLASGVTLNDALLQGVYELIERDGWAIADFVRSQTGLEPPRVTIDDGPPELQLCLDHLRAAHVHPFIFDLSTDLSVPIFYCILIPEADREMGLFCGYGCSLDACTAIRRAITEAAQARCCYFSGARDDLFRRKFLSMKHISLSTILASYNYVSVAKTFSDYSIPPFSSIDDELQAVVNILEAHNVDMYYKPLHTCGDPYIYIVRCVSTDLSSVPCPTWVPNKRCRDALPR